MSNVRSMPKTLSSHELDLLTSVSDTSTTTVVAERNACLFRFMANTGARVSEAAAVRIQDVEWKTGRILLCRCKGGTERFVWVSAEELEVLRQAIDRRPVQSEYLFCTNRGLPLHPSYVRQALKRKCTIVGVSQRFHPHSLRHTFATDLYRQTKDIRLVQRALGHRDIRVTEIYTHIADDTLAAAFRTLRERSHDA